MKQPREFWFVDGKVYKTKEDAEYNSLKNIFITIHPVNVREVITSGDESSSHNLKLQDEISELKDRFENADSFAKAYAYECGQLRGDNEYLKNKLTESERKLGVAVEALNSIACLDKAEMNRESCWLKFTHEECAEVLATDTQIARSALEEIERVKP